MGSGSAGVGPGFGSTGSGSLINPESLTVHIPEPTAVHIPDPATLQVTAFMKELQKKLVSAIPPLTSISSSTDMTSGKSEI